MILYGVPLKIHIQVEKHHDLHEPLYQSSSSSLYWWLFDYVHSMLSFIFTAE